MLITGTIKSIIFQNEENGYTVINLSTDSGTMTCVGTLPMVNVGESLELEGEITINKNYGEQLKITHAKVLQPQTESGITRYLASGLIKGVGKVTAERIVKQFGKETLNIIEFNPSRLMEVRGISEQKAIVIAESYITVKKMQDTIMYLQEYDISSKMAIKIYETYHERTMEKLKTNPYALVEDVDGIGFLTADKIASKLGIPFDSDFRLRAGLLHCLKEGADKDGHTYMPASEVYKEVTLLLKINFEDFEEKIEKILFQMQIDGIIKCDKIYDVEVLMLTKYYNIEKSSAKKILSLLNHNLDERDFSQEIANFEALNGIELHSQQKQAVETAVNSGFSVITGGPGTGKTTIIKCVLSLMKNQRRSTLLLAPTGRAAKRMSESCGEEAKTIHRALELDFSSPNDCFRYNEFNKLPYDCIIVDEVSMVDVVLLNALLKALKRTCQVILVGDKDQLPSVGAGNVLADILNSEVVPYVCLTEIYRQAKESLIVLNAHAINQGQMPKIDNKSKDFFFESKKEPSDMLDTIVALTTTRLPNFTGVEPSKIQVLAPLKNGLCGIENLNKVLQEKINSPSKMKTELFTERMIFRLNDKVMQIVNNYELEWQKVDDNGYVETGEGVFNGDIGTITSVDYHKGEVEVTFEDGRICVYPKNELINLQLAYAMTIHKSQGSEFDVVVIPIIAGTGKILTRNLLYTAVTRAKKLVVLVGSTFYLKRMVENDYTAKRYSSLCWFLKNLNEEQ